jgi:hypothetical protein
MSLMRLLTAGKSLVGSANPESRYRMYKRGLLPKFGSGKNPFMAAHSEGQEANSPVAQQAKPVEVAANLKETKRLPVLEASAAVGKLTQSAPGLKRAPESKFLGPRRWMQKLKGFIFRPRARTPAKSALPRFNQPPIQGELSLEKVKVVRNDLSDTDFEVVPAKLPQVEASSGPAAEEPAPPELAGSAVGRVASRFFGANET